MKLVNVLLYLCALSLAGFPLTAAGQVSYSGTVIDSYTQRPISGAEVVLKGNQLSTSTNSKGEFLLTGTGDDDHTGWNLKLTPNGNHLKWESNRPVDLKLFHLSGQVSSIGEHSVSGRGEFDLSTLLNGIYVLKVQIEGNAKTYKLVKQSHALMLSQSRDLSTANLKSAVSADSLIISKNGYFVQTYACQNTTTTYELLKQKYDHIECLFRLIRPEAFSMLEGNPLNSAFSEVKSVKLVYSISDQILYYTNSSLYNIHYEFCANVLGYNKGHYTFNIEQYSYNPNRLYILASLNHFISSNIYTIDFFAGDELTCSDIGKVFNKVSETFYLDSNLWLYANSTSREGCTNVPIISSDDLYAGQNYQALNLQENYGYLKKVSESELKNSYLGRHDLLVLNALPIDVPVVAGIITTEFQTPLSHINVLSHNRGTPNMALRDAWTNPKITLLENKLVHLKVMADSFDIREATLAEAQNFWSEKEPQTPHRLQIDTLTSGLIDLNKANIQSVSMLGGKAANFAELTKVKADNTFPIPLPEGYFAIPFFYYWQHIKQFGLDRFIDQMLKEARFQSDMAYRKAQLKILRDSIKNSPLDAQTLQLVKNRLSNQNGFTEFRFRSSTNAEDIEGFNGAGLYESHTGSLANPEKPIDKAIKKVWASLWDFGAFEERDYFKIDHRTIAMGILVHRSYPSEAANGVVITKNIYNLYNPAITINVQVGEISVVNPTDNYLPDQILYYTYSDESIIEYLNHSNVPGMEGKTVMTDAELKLLKDYCMAIHYHYCQLNLGCVPIDIEFKVDVVDGQRKLYIKQARLY